MRKSKNESIVIAKHIGTFLNDHLYFHGYSENTIKNHEYALSIYLCFLEKEKRIVPEKLSGDCFCKDYIEEWMRWMADARKCSPQTCNVRLGSLRRFLKYLADKDISMLHISEEASRIERRKHPSKKIKGMSRAAVTALMAEPNVKTATGLRDLSLLVVLYGTAARIDEVLSMKIGHLNLEAKKPYVVVIGKGDKLRTLYLLPKAVVHLKQYIKEAHGESPDPESYIFFSRNKGLKSMMTQVAVSKRLKIYAIKAYKKCKEVPLTVHPHQLRHAKASHWLDEGVNIVQISLLLGHEQLKTTMVYLDVSLEQKSGAIATLEDENSRTAPKKWKSDRTSLSSFCGVRTIK